MIKHLHQTERPRERCLQSGATHLSLRECLAVLLGSGPRGVGCMGLANRILKNRSPTSNDNDSLETLVNEPSFQGVEGLGQAGQARLLVCFELAKRFACLQEHKKPMRREARRLQTPLSQQALARIPWNERVHPREWIGFVPVFSDGRVGSFSLVERGLRSHVNFDVQLFFKLVLASQQTIGLFLFHNHPSGGLVPSADDRRLTNELADLCARLHLHFAGHWIVSGASERQIEQDC